MTPTVYLHPIRCLLAMCIAWATAGVAMAEQYSYDISLDASQIEFSVSGAVFGGALEVVQQFPGEITPYDGSIMVAYPGSPGPGGTIGFPGGSSAVAQILWDNSSDMPLAVSPAIGGAAGTDPANYGVALDAPVEYDLPPFELPDLGLEIDLGVLESVTMDIAFRDIVLDLTSPTATQLDVSAAFDASVVDLGIASGFADVNGALVLQQEDWLAYGISLVALNSLIQAYPDMGLTITGDLSALEIEVGMGTQYDLSILPGAMMLPNQPIDDGTASYDPLTGESLLVIPIEGTLPDLDIPAEILDLNISMSGVLSAAATVPEPSGLVLFGLAVLAALAVVAARCATPRGNRG